MAKKTLAQKAREDAEAFRQAQKKEKVAAKKAIEDTHHRTEEAEVSRVRALHLEGEKTMTDGPYSACVKAVERASAAGKNKVDVELFRFNLKQVKLRKVRDLNEPFNPCDYRDIDETPNSDDYHRACGAAEAVVEKLRKDDDLKVSFIQRIIHYYDDSDYGARRVSLRGGNKEVLQDDTSGLLRGRMVTEEYYNGLGEEFIIKNKGVLEVRITF